MDKFVIEGGHKLRGTVRVSGAKNAALPLFAATILIPEPITFLNVPDVADIRTMAQLLRDLGAKVHRIEKGVWKIDTSTISETVAPYDVVKRMRASIYVLGPLIARFGKARVSLPGGCAFGPRPVDFHIRGLKLMQADIKVEHGYIVAQADKLRSASIAFDKKSVGATAHLMMAATLADGKVTIENAALEPEVVTLAEFLKLAGAKISGEGTDEIVIEGVDALKSPGEFEVIPDRIEAGTYAVAAYMTGGEVTITDLCAEHLRTVLEKLREAGSEFEMDKSSRSLRILARNSEIKPLDIFTSPFPGFPTDMQAQFMAMLTIADGTSVIREGIYPDRFKHAFELTRLGADIKVDDGIAVVKGVKELTGAPVMASDLRASAALVLAGLVARGTTVVDRIYHLDRGYEDFELKLSALGAHIKRVS